MKNFTTQAYLDRGYSVFCMIDDSGDRVRAFDDFVESLVDANYAAATVKRYLEVVAGFIDYLVEAGVFGTAVTIKDLNRAVERYIPLRLHADRYLALSDEAVPGTKAGDHAEAMLKKELAATLGLRSVLPSANMPAALNRFLRLSELLAQTEREGAGQFGLLELPVDYRKSILAVQGFSRMPAAQRKALSQASMLANVIRMRPDGIQMPRGLRNPKARRDRTETRLDFPIGRVADLCSAARTWRDAALWLLLAGAGLRMSEAMGLRWRHVDAVGHKVYVEDPNGMRFPADLRPGQRMRFKGRTVADTYIIQPFRDRLFEALASYKRLEDVAGSTDDFVFQDIRPKIATRRPMHMLSDNARIRCFKRAAARAGIPGPTEVSSWTPHSLRHAYGVYLLNFLPVPGGYGLTLKEVQKLMGHASEVTTSHYARAEASILEAKLAFADAKVIDIGSEAQFLPKLIAGRLRLQAELYERGDLA